jgi:HD-like signal output (HDOD) protein
MSAAQSTIESTASDGEDRLFQAVYLACSKGDLDMPPMPEVAARLAKMADDPEVKLPEVARVVEADPAVAGAVLRAANSVLYCTGKPVGDLKSAVIRLGVGLTRTLATSYALRQTFRVTSASVKQRMRELWEHSLDVSTLSWNLARRLKGYDPERALLCGLIHDVGVIPVLTYVERSELSLEPAALEGAIRKLRVMVGLLVANYWGLDKELTGVITDAEAWMREASAKHDLCDVVLVAQHLHFTRTPRREPLPQLETLPAYHRLGLCPMDSLQILYDAAKEVAAVKAWLSS